MVWYISRCFFFFSSRRRHTRCSRDWSSDVCSSDLPCAFAMAALLSRRLDTDWLVAIRKWTLVSWLFLSIVLLLGMWWAYVELGWGGYWGWDPVENAALLPWLTMTAFLHSVMIQEK